MIKKKPVTREVYVGVNLDVTPGGFACPRTIWWPDGRVFTIDRVRDWRPDVESKKGRLRDVYTVLIRGQVRYLYFEKYDPAKAEGMFREMIGRWYVKVTEPAQ